MIAAGFTCDSSHDGKRFDASDVQVAFDDQTVAEAIVTLAEGHVHGLQVVDRPNKLGC